MKLGITDSKILNLRIQYVYQTKKNKEIKEEVKMKFNKIILSIMIIMALAITITVASASDDNRLRLYGENGLSAEFPYTDAEAPFDPMNDQAPPKDFVVFNPAYVTIPGLYVSDIDSREKVFVRQWFVPELEEPVGRVWLDDPNIYIWEDVVTEYTYMFIDKHYEPTYGTALSPSGSFWTRFWLPIADNDDSQIGIDGCDVNFDGNDDWTVLREIGDFDNDGRKDISISSETFELIEGEKLQFLDHMIEIKNVGVVSGSPASIDLMVDIYYLGNDEPECIRQNYNVQIVPNQFVRAGRHTVNTGNPNFYEPWYIKGISTGGDRAYVQVGRLLHTGETFFVDGSEYDIAMIYGPEETTDEYTTLKYITIRNPVPEHQDVDLEDLSIIKECVMDNELLPLLPPFNRVHTMVDDISIPNDMVSICTDSFPDNIGNIDDGPIYGTVDHLMNDYDTVLERLIPNVAPLEIYFTGKDDETRFDTNLLEILDESLFNEQIPIDVILAIDASGSMSTNDPTNARLAAAKDFIDMLDPSRDQVGLVAWDNSIIFSQGLTDDFADVKTQIDTIVPDSGTNLNAGLDESIGLLDDSTRESVKVIIFLSDGEGTYTPCGSSGPVDDAADAGYKVYTIGLNTATTQLEDIASCTGGDYYPDVTTADISEIYEEVFEDITIIKEGWKWLDVYTMPRFYKEFVYPVLPDVDGGTGDFLVVSSWKAPNSCYERVVFAYDQETGEQDIYINDYDEYNALRLYGEDESFDAAFPYIDPEAPFDPRSEEAPQKDFITFNPAIVRMNGIFANNIDSKEKVFARQWFIPYYIEPVGDVWIDDPNYYESEDVITEYTYMFIDKHYNPTFGTPLSPGGSYWTRFWMPIADNDDAQIGIDGCDIDGDGNDDWLWLKDVGDWGSDGGAYSSDGRKDIDISSDTFEMIEGEELTFLDHKVVVKNVQVVSGSPDSISMMVDIYYTGNDEPELIKQNFVAQIIPGEYVRAGRHTAQSDSPDFYEPWYIQAISTGGNRAYIQVGRLLHTAETFFVDGAEYDISMIYGPEVNDDEFTTFKYITIRNPVPEHEDITLEDLSVTKECVEDGEVIPLLPPFNRVHEMVDDISIPDDMLSTCTAYFPDNIGEIDDGPIYGREDHLMNEYDTIEERIISDIPALEIFFTGKDIEPRFDTNLLEILCEEYRDESWWWLDIQTKPDFYKEFVYPELPDVDGGEGDWFVTSSFIAPNSCNERVMFAYDAATGTGLYMNQGENGEDICGDINGDGTLNTGDVILLRNHLANSDTYPLKCEDCSADVNGDGTLNTGDVILLRNHLANSEYSLECIC